MSGVGKRFIKAGTLVVALACFEYRPAIQAFHIFRIAILGNQLRARMLAGSRIVHGMAPSLCAS
jgi:hypothetical protein